MAVGLAVLVIESLHAPPEPLAPAAGDADVIDLRLGRAPPPAPVIVEPGRPAPGASPAAGSGAASPGGQPGDAGQAGTAPPPGGAPAGGRQRDDPADYYVVKPGDSLSTIAQQQLGSASKADELVRLNRLADADSVIVGQVLRLR